MRIESATLTITPTAALRWHRDVEDNSVAIATFETPAGQLAIESDVVSRPVHRSGPLPGPGRTLRERLPRSRAVGAQLGLDTCVGRGLSARRGLEVVRSLHRRDGRRTAHPRGRGAPAGVRPAGCRHFPRQAGSQPQCQCLGIGAIAGLEAADACRVPSRRSATVWKTTLRQRTIKADTP